MAVNGWCRTICLSVAVHANSSAILGCAILICAAWLGVNAAAATPPAAVPSATAKDDERVATYREFRAAFDARRYADALPLADKVKQLTELQHGADDRALVNPLCNLATVQLRLRNYAAAIPGYQRAIDIIDGKAAGGDQLLVRPLHGLGETYLALKQYPEAAVALKRALDLTRNLNGLFNVDQLVIVDGLIDAYVQLERTADADKEHQYAFRVAETAYGRNDLRLLGPIDRLARWHEYNGRYTTARTLHARGLQLAEAKAGGGTIQSVDPLRGLARSYLLEFLYGPEEVAVSPTDDPFAAPTATDANGNARLNPEGERALKLAVLIQAKVKPANHAKLGATLMDLGDYDLLGNSVPVALDAYRQAWTEFSAEGNTAVLQAPRRISYRPPASSATRARPAKPDEYEERFVEARFTVTREGKVTDAVVGASDANPAVEKAVLAAVRKARFGPRIEAGLPVETKGVTLRERVLVHKVAAPAAAAPATTSSIGTASITSIADVAAALRASAATSTAPVASCLATG